MFSISVIIQKISILYLFFNISVNAHEGRATFYGQDTGKGRGEAGACLLKPGFNNVEVTVAMNPYQYENGLACGKCVYITPKLDPQTGKNQGIGMTPIINPIFATVDNLCPECENYQIDLALKGDGIWQIKWDFVKCPTNGKVHAFKNETIPPGVNGVEPRGNRFLRKNNISSKNETFESFLVSNNTPPFFHRSNNLTHRNLRFQDDFNKLKKFDVINGSRTLTIIVFVGAFLLILFILAAIWRFCKSSPIPPS